MSIHGFRMAAAASLAAILPACTMHTSTGSTTTAVRETQTPGLVKEDVLHENGLEELWNYQPQPTDRGVHMVELAGDGIFIATRQTAEGSKGRLKLALRSNGNTAWIYETEEDLRYPPSIYQYPPGGEARPEVFLSQLDTVHCLDLKWGDLLWKQSLSFPISTRIAADEAGIFLGSSNGRAYGVKKKSPVEDWTYRTGKTITASPVVSGANVFFASNDGSVYRFATRTGWVPRASWKLDTGASITGDPVAYSRWILAGSTDYKLYCLEAQDGSIFWSFLAEAPILDAPVVYSYRTNQEYVYLTAVEGGDAQRGARTLFSVKLTNGQEAWRKQGVSRVVSIGKNNIYAINQPSQGEGKLLLALDILTGEERFRIPVDRFAFIPTNLADNGRNQKERGRIYLVAEDGTIQVIGERL